MATDSACIEELSINTVRTLAMDAVQAANSGHPGTPMALAPVAYKLWNDVLCYDPQDPFWPDRDRFVLSCGHASMLLYALIHLAGVRQVSPDGKPMEEASLPLSELENFRQLNSRTPGHPELGHPCGTETTTGPLGQGCGNSVGMAIAQRWLAGHFNRPGFPLFDYSVYAICSDGDLMEGVGSEAASLAGHLRLSNLCWIYDNNHITIEGHTELAFSEDVAQRFGSLGWLVVQVDDANDLGALGAAFNTFAAHSAGPTIIIVSSHIAYGAPHKQDTSEAHGAPLGAEEVRLTKASYGWPQEPSFLVPDEVREHFRQGIGHRGSQKRQAWETILANYREKFPELFDQWQMIWQRKLPAGWDAQLPEFPVDAKGVATRSSSGQVLNAIAKNVPWLIGGSADLAPSTKTTLTFAGAGQFLPFDHTGRNFHFGVREHAMGAIVNGIGLSGVRAFGATFFVFSDYLRPSLRLSAMMQLPSIFVFTHDSIGVGEDGPTHQPAEQLAAVRAIPGLIVLRPADANEVVEAWRAAINSHDRPVALVLTRQNLPTLDRGRCAPAAGLKRGGYVLIDSSEETPKAILIGTGSEVSLCVQACDRLSQEGIGVRVVSMPSWELFDQQDQAYRERVLPPEVRVRVAVEAGVSQGWEKYLGFSGRFVGMRGYGQSGPYQEVYRQLGITPEAIVSEVHLALGS